MGQVDDGSGRFHLTRRHFVAIALVAIIVAATLVYVYYSMSVASATSLTIDEVLADRKYVSGTYPNRNATFIIEVQVWSKAQALSVKLEKPIFSAELPGVPLGSGTFGSGTLLPGSYLTYNLRFTINESRNFGTISFPNSTVLVKMTTLAEAGLYSQTVTVADTALWDWTTATLIKNYG